jgi:DivIVA domain-containing protein
MSSGTMFRRVTGVRSGYHPEEVDDFFGHAKSVYESGPAGALSSKDVRTVSFDLVRHGYSTTAVDAALDRLEAAFVARARQEYIAEHGRQAWLETLAEQARSLYGRLTRPDGERFAYFDQNAPLTAQEIRSSVFTARKGAGAYDEASVDAFFERAVDVLLAAE